MLLIVGALVVLAAIVAGYLMEGGALLALNQPAEFVIIGGAALGSLLISTPLPLPEAHRRQRSARFFKSGPGKQDYLEMLGMMYQTVPRHAAVRRDGARVALRRTRRRARSSRDSRSSSPTTTRVDFFADSVRVIIIGGIGPHDFEALMDVDLEVQHHEALKPAQALAKVGDALPGLGIVAAVLGVVITMGAIDGPAGGDRPQGRRRAGRHVPRHSAVVRLRAADGDAHRAARSTPRAVHEPVHQGGRARALTRASRRRSPSSSRAASMPAELRPTLRRDRAVLPRAAQATPQAAGGMSP